MKIHNLHVRNFKKFAELTLDLHPQFTLLVGENGSGKTSLLDALAVALGVWLLFHQAIANLTLSRPPVCI